MILFNKFSVLFLSFLSQQVIAGGSSYCSVEKYNNEFFNKHNARLIRNYKDTTRKAYGLYNCNFESLTMLKCYIDIDWERDDEVEIYFNILGNNVNYLENSYGCNLNYQINNLKATYKSIWGDIGKAIFIGGTVGCGTVGAAFGGGVGAGALGGACAVLGILLKKE